MMRPAFSSTRQAGAFALLLLVLLSLPAVVGKNLLPSREQAYAAQGWGTGPFPWIQQQLFEEKGDIDIAFVGSSHILHAIDATRIQAALSRKLNRPATVRVIGWGGAGYDALYFITKDLLEHRKVNLLVFYDEDIAGGSRNPKSPTWFRWGDDAGALAGLPVSEQAYFYFASLVGMPRNLLDRLRPNLPADLHVPNYWEEHYRSSNIANNLGSTTSELGLASFAGADTDPAAPFFIFSPINAATAADACIYSATTQTNFEFAKQPLPPWQNHFLRLFATLVKDHGCKILLLHIPALKEVRSPVIRERLYWPSFFGPDLTMLGVPPARMFAGMPDQDVDKLYFNQTHLNKNGQAYFTTLILPSILQIYETQDNH
jgi:hypothetical protein